MKIPGPDHPIHIRAADRRWRARFEGHVIADSAGALVLKESTYPEVIYFPRDDVSMEYLSRTTHSTHCPYKGDASYYSLLMDGRLEENAVWTYEQPYPAMQAIDGYLAFYADRVELYEVDDAAVNPRHVPGGETVDEVVQHTDAGDGHAQREHWRPTERTPDVEGGVR
ncbi:MAG: DUF427 domain-containing protein [Phenylobacterium sp.]|uniref:DUF427 domain-containing protein n=1 Tax=Phenylobacterium sp. TaxID=1871053 RepID=UPI001A50D616|nr:DUF427 domain-containing protein [Phenylobacterium sp.]MBL8553072.1 DUF427 domain-containing protein [Phenylobacterium sp.]